jgi:protein-tyrosine phosphatase
MRAIRILAANVMIPRGLIGLGRDTLDQSGPEIRTALLAIVQPPPPPPPSSSSNLPMVIHCTQGKDRTGLVVMLALMVLRVPAEAIAHDYRLTDAALVTEKEGRLEEIRDLGLPDEFGDTAPAMIEETERYLDTKYGGIDGYLDAIQFGPEERQKMRDILLY